MSSFLRDVSTAYTGDVASTNHRVFWKKRKKYQNVAITYAFRIIGDCRKLANIPFNFEEHKSRYYGIVKLEFKISYLTSRD